MFHRQLMFVSTIVLTAGASAQGDWTYNPTTNHWYQLTAPGLTWTQAEQAAVSLGGHLVSINDGNENAWILAQLGQQSRELWIGLTQPSGSPEPAGGWEWVNGDSLTYVNWSLGEPNNDGGLEHVGVMMAALNPPGHFGEWLDGIDSAAAAYRPGVVEIECPPGIACPTVSEWGIVVMAVFVLAIGIFMLSRARRIQGN